MRLFRIRRPSPATVIASVALLVALGGTGYAAVSIPANSVGTAQLQANAVTSGKVLNGTLQKVDFKAGQLPAGAAGPAGSAGSVGPAGAPGSAFAYAHVLSTGFVDPATSKNVDIQDLVLVGVHCLVVTGGTPKNVTAMIDNTGADPRTSQIAGNVAPPGSTTAAGCLSGDNVEIVTSSGGRFVNLPFYVAIN